MVQSIDKERVMGTIKHVKSVVDFFTGAVIVIIVSCLFSPNLSVIITGYYCWNYNGMYWMV